MHFNTPEQALLCHLDPNTPEKLICIQNKYDLINENLDMKQLFDACVRYENIEMLNYIIKNFNIPDSFVTTDSIICQYECEKTEMFNILRQFDKDNKALNQILEDAKWTVEHYSFIVKDIEKILKEK